MDLILNFGKRNILGRGDDFSVHSIRNTHESSHKFLLKFFLIYSNV